MFYRCRPCRRRRTAWQSRRSGLRYRVRIRTSVLTISRLARRWADPGARDLSLAAALLLERRERASRQRVGLGRFHLVGLGCLR